MIVRNSSKNLNKELPSNSPSRILNNRNFYMNNKNNSHRIRPIQINSPRRQPFPTKTNDFYNYQRSVISSLPKQTQIVKTPQSITISNKNNINKTNTMRKTFAITKNNFNKNSTSNSTQKNKIMMNTTTSRFRPPTGFRRSNDEDYSNYLSKGTFGVVLLAKKREKQQKFNLKLQSEEPKYEGQLNPQQNLTSISINSLSVPNEQSQHAQNKQDNLLAIKVYQKFRMNKDPAKFKNIRKQINVMQNINHPNIIKLYQSVDTLTKISLVVEYGGKQSLLDYLKRKFPLSLQKIKSIGFQLLSALSYLHQKNIVHRDIKLQNILMHQGNVKLIDFGFSTVTHHNRKLNAICGTPNYMAPQLLSKKEYIGQQADIWSFGIVMYTLGEGRHPFKAESYNELERLTNKGRFQFKRIQDPNYQSFIRKILKVKPNQRPRIGQLLNSSWLTQS